ncbi:Ser/Thr protein kinase RdoA (MazF antagonist) [Streptomyces achromogenes]|uniref:Ser/Thr protein kinase RdoA (MazF antagonist) n=1 Tax=Streptomyces achromogenes TaxID=67255 RepID=A0ABU0Q310_STRAH|nr:phosphotransferase [Streptomyces achromogenes]MDQ0685055.1 Ser/Thr protein kinase RdoA (MazF antagonist) [Streptomyces achromogenes]
MPHAPPLSALLRRYAAGTALACEPVDEGLLNRGYRLRTTRGRYFLKHHFDPDTADPVCVARQHRATERLADLGVPVAPPLPAHDGRTVAVVGGRVYALHPWVEGRHRHGAQLTAGQCGRLGALLGVVHASLEHVMRTAREPERTPCAAQRAPARGPQASAQPSADPADAFVLIDDLLARVRRRRPADAFDELARHRLLERRTLLERHADRRPPHTGPVGWVHGDFHPFNLLYRGDAPAAIVDWDRLGVQPRAEEAVRAAAIFFVRPDGTLDLPKARAYARAYRRTAGAAPCELAAAVHRVWWERLNDFWMLRWHYERGDTRADPQFPAASALAVWWTREYHAVCGAFTG